MRISTIALANLKRRKGRAAFLIIGISIGIATAVALLVMSRMMKEEIGLQLDQYGANIIVVPKSNSLALDYGGISVSGVSFDVNQLKNEDAQRILNIPYRNRLSVIAPKILGAAEIEGKQVLLAGVDFKSEMKLKRWWRLVGEKPQSEGDLLIGYEAARVLSLIEPSAHDMSVSVMKIPDIDAERMSHHAHSSTEAKYFKLSRDRLTIAGHEYRVAGVITPTGGREDVMVFASLANVQSLLGRPGQISLIEVSAMCQGCPVEDIVAQISGQLPNAKVTALQQAVQARTQTVERLTRFAAVVAAVVLLIGALMIFTTMTGAVIERTKEIGILRAIGFRKSHIIKGLMIEVLVISATGGLLGWLAGLLISWSLLPYFSQTKLPFEIDPLLGVASVGAALLVGSISSLYPTIRAAKLDPSESVRYV